MSISPIEQSTLGHRVAEQLRSLIVKGELAPGQRFSEEELAERFGVSRGPVRDALRIMVSERLMEPRRKGVQVAGFDERDIDELYSLRDALESLAVRMLVGQRQSVEWDRFGPTVSAMRAAAADNQFQAFAEADLGFHAELCAASGHRRLMDTWNSYQPTFAALVQETVMHEIDLKASADKHTELLELVQKGRLAPALRSLEEHLNRACDLFRSAHRHLAEAAQS
jgi:GntR family transcriptional regulator of gluconate operon